MLARRIRGGLIVAAVGFTLAFAGGWLYTIGISLVLAAAAREYINMFQLGDHNPNPYPVMAASFLISVLANYMDYDFSGFAAVFAVFLIMVIKIFQYKKVSQTAASDLAIELSALAFIALPGMYLIRLRMLPDGLYWILIGILPVCAADVTAFAVGTMFGRHKLAPAISPKKTVEGFASGVAGAILIGAVINLIFRERTPSVSLATSLLISLAVSIISPLGDLAKSIVKRHFSLKDTANLIPGHGGILDRIDTWLWAAPTAYFIAAILIK